METIIALIIAIAIFSYCLFHIRIFIFVDYRRHDSNDNLAVEVYLLQKIIRYQLRVPAIALTDEGLPFIQSKMQTVRRIKVTKENSDLGVKKAAVKSPLYELDDWKEFIRELKTFNRLYEIFSKKVEKEFACEKFYWRTGFRDEDPAVTGIVIGLLWALKSLYFTKLQRRVRVNVKPFIAVAPISEGCCFETEFKCIFSIRLGNVINAVFSLANLVSKGGKTQWANTRSRV